MSIIRIKSENLNMLCESLQKISLFEDDLEKSDIQKDNNDNKFYVDLNVDDKDLDNVAINMNDSDEVEEIEDPEVEKEQLNADFINALQDYLDTSSVLKDIINKYQNLQNEQNEQMSNEWSISNLRNDIVLASRNAHIFKQNKNICLSHDNEIEIFKNASELKKFLKDNEFPDLKDGQLEELHESTIDEVTTLLEANYPDNFRGLPGEDERDYSSFISPAFAVKTISYSQTDNKPYNTYVLKDIIDEDAFELDDILGEELSESLGSVIFNEVIANAISKKFNKFYPEKDASVIEVYGYNDHDTYYLTPEDAISAYKDDIENDIHNNYLEDSVTKECCGGCGGITLGNIAPAAKYTVPAMKKKKKND